MNRAEVQMSDAIAGALIQGAFTLVGILVAIKIGQQSSRASRKLVEDERDRQAAIVAARIAIKLNFLADEAKFRAEEMVQPLEKRISAGEKVTQELLQSGAILTEIEWVDEMRQNTLLFDKDCGIRVLSTFDFIKTAMSRIETTIRVNFKPTRPLDTRLQTLDTIQDVLHRVATTCKEAQHHLQALYLQE